MKKRTLAYGLGGICALLLLLAAGVWYYAQSRADVLLAEVAATAETKAADVFGVPVQIGAIEVKSLNEIELHNVAVYDKQAECIAHADKARVSFRLLSVFDAQTLFQQPAEAVKEVALSGLTATLQQRADGTWNVADIQSSSSGQTPFQGQVTVTDGTLTLARPDLAVTLTEVQGSADFADYPVLRTEFTARSHGAPVKAQGTISAEKQIVNVTAQDVELADYLALLPEGTLPNGLTLNGGKVTQAKVAVLNRQGAPLSLTGTADFTDGVLTVRGTQVDHIAGHAQFTQQSALVQAAAEVAGQAVQVHGAVRWDTGTPYLDIYAQADSFDPGLVLTHVPYSGAAAFDVHVTGLADNPAVEGTVTVPQGTCYGVTFSDAGAKLRFREQRLYLQDIRAQVLGGQVTGEAEVTPQDLSYTGHLQVKNLDVAQAGELVPALAVQDVTGRATADIGFNGTGTSLEALQAYGSVRVRDGSVRGVTVEDASASFSLRGRDIDIDYLSLNLPQRSSLGLEGTIREGQDLDLAFYGGHMDLSLVRQLIPEADITGFGDLEGTVRGNIANPQVELKFSAMHGKFFKQPYDSLKIKAGGSLDGVHVDDFMLEKDGQQTWFVQGTVGFTGERKLDLRIDTKGARMEDVVALVAPDQPLTGNIDNVIQLKGTLDNPEGVGYIHFYRGSYGGVLLSGMDGDYFLNNGVMRLQDFHLFSPMVDAVLNGTIDMAYNLDLVVKAADLDMARFQVKMPYEVSGHGTFDGQIKGTLNAPEFHGVLDAPRVVLNGQAVEQLHGFIHYKNDQISVERFGFVQNNGSYDMELAYNRDTEAIQGSVVVQDADVNAIAAILNYRNDKLQGHLTCTADIGGTLTNPLATLHGELAQGSVSGYDVHGVALDVHLLDRMLYIDKLQGQQGTDGQFSLQGSASLDGPLKGTLSAQNIQLGIFTGLADVPLATVGTADIEAAIGGYTQNPTIDATIRARDGGIKGSTFDTLNSVLHLKNGQIDVDSLNVQKMVGQQTYQLSAEGVVPLNALWASQKPDEANDIEQIMLTVSLDHADLSLLPVFANQVEWAVGATQGSVTIMGTAANPRIKGSLVTPDGGVKLKALEKPLTNVHVQADFNGRTMTLQDISAKMGDGVIRGNGHAELAGLALQNYALDLQADKLDVQSDFFRGPLTGELHVSEGELFGHKMPKLAGRLDFAKCQISVPTIPDTSGDLPRALLDLQVNVGDKVHFYSAYLYDMYLTGQVHFGGTTRHPRTSGSLTVKRGGTVNYLKTVFHIDEGSAYFNQVDSFLPSITFHATTKLTQAKVFLALDGPLDAMNITLTASPEMSQTEIIQLLTLRNAYKAGKQIDAGDLLNVGLQMSFLSEVEDVMRKMLWLDDFTLSRGSGSALDQHDRESQDNDNDVYNVSMGKYISDKVMLKYTQGIGDNVHRYGVQYDLNDRYGFTLENESGATIVGAQVQVKF